MNTKQQQLAMLHSRGFDLSTLDKSQKIISLGCSQCNPLAVNGVATHEHGCPNQTFECKGCNAQVSRRGTYCEDCQ